MTNPRPAAILPTYVAAAAMVSISTLAGLALAPRWGVGAVDMLFVPSVLASAVLLGRGPSAAAAVLSALAYNYFFVPPVHSFRINRSEDILTVSLLLVVALVTSELAARMRTQSRLAAANAARNAIIAGVARKLLSCRTPEAIGAVATSELAAVFACNATLVILDGAVLGGAPHSSSLNPSDLAAAAEAIKTGKPAGRGVPQRNPADWLFYPVCDETRAIASMGLARDDGSPPVASEQVPLLTNLLDQVALAVSRTALEAELRDVEAIRERDRLRGALLSSVGHDLRTPLTAIAAAAAELRATNGDTKLAAVIQMGASTLERYISNLLDMARIEAGGVRVRREPTDLIDAVAAALRDLKRQPEDAGPNVSFAVDLPLVVADPELLHHMLINLIDNAAKHGGGATGIDAVRENDCVRLLVADSGPGLPAPAEELFTRFDRIAGNDRRGGSGLGLAIVKAFGDAMGVEVTAANREDGPGARFALVFPQILALE